MADPLYRQIAEDLRGQIEAGQLDPGAKLPAENEFQPRYGASRNTIRDAIRLLAAWGLVETINQLDLYVCAPIGISVDGRMLASLRSCR
jgi:GntR family transcriptional regulator